MALTANTAIIINGSPANGIQHVKDALVGIADDGDTTTVGSIASGGGEDEVQLITKGSASQTADLQQWTDSSDAVQAKVQANGRMYTSSGLLSDSLEGGAGLAVFPNGGIVIVTADTSADGSFDLTGGTADSLFTDTVNSPFTQANADSGDLLVVRSGVYKGAMAIIDEYIDASNVVLHTMGWTFDLTDVSYRIIESPMFLTGDGFHSEFHTHTSGHVDIHSDDWVGNTYSNVMFEAEMGAAVDGVDCALFEAEANGYASVQALIADYTAGDIGVGKAGGAVGARIDVSEATSADATTEIDCYLAVVIDGTNATTTAYKVLPGFTNALEVQGAVSIDPSYGYDVDDSTATVTDRVTGAPQAGTAFLSSSTTDVTLIADAGDYVLIGGAATFEIVEFAADTGGSKDSELTFEYSTGDGTWSTLTILADGTKGFQQSGQISFSAPLDWAVGETAEVASDITSGYYVRITRTRVPVMSTLPIEDYFKVFSSRELGFIVRGGGTVQPVHIADADTPNDSLYYSIDSSKLAYKDSSGTVNVLY